MHKMAVSVNKCVTKAFKADIMYNLFYVQHFWVSKQALYKEGWVYYKLKQSF